MAEGTEAPCGKKRLEGTSQTQGRLKFSKWEYCWCGALLKDAEGLPQVLLLLRRLEQAEQPATPGPGRLRQKSSTRRMNRDRLSASRREEGQTHPSWLRPSEQCPSVRKRHPRSPSLPPRWLLLLHSPPPPPHVYSFRVSPPHTPGVRLLFSRESRRRTAAGARANPATD